MNIANDIIEKYISGDMSDQDFSSAVINAYSHRFSGEGLAGEELAAIRRLSNVAGRFITEDSTLGNTTDALSQNRYTYTQNDPINNSDPTGHAIGSSPYELWMEQNGGINEIYNFEVGATLQNKQIQATNYMAGKVNYAQGVDYRSASAINSISYVSQSDANRYINAGVSEARSVGATYGCTPGSLTNVVTTVFAEAVNATKTTANNQISAIEANKWANYQAYQAYLAKLAAYYAALAKYQAQLRAYNDAFDKAHAAWVAEWQAAGYAGPVYDNWMMSGPDGKGYDPAFVFNMARPVVPAWALEPPPPPTGLNMACHTNNLYYQPGERLSSVSCHVGFNVSQEYLDNRRAPQASNTSLVLLIAGCTVGVVAAPIIGSALLSGGLAAGLASLGTEIWAGVTGLGSLIATTAGNVKDWFINLLPSAPEVVETAPESTQVASETELTGGKRLMNR